MASLWHRSHLALSAPPVRGGITRAGTLLMGALFCLFGTTHAGATDCATVTWDSRARVCDARLFRIGAATEFPDFIRSRCKPGSALTVAFPRASLYHAFVSQLCASMPTSAGDTVFRCALR